MKDEIKRAMILGSGGVLAVLVLCLFTGQAEIFRKARIEVSDYIDAAVYKQGGVEYDLSELGGGSKHTIEDDGTPMTDRAALNFDGPGVSVSDDAGNDATVITITGDGMTDDEVEQAYNAEVPAASQIEMETGTETAIRRMTPERVKQSVIEHAPVDSVNGQTGAASLDADDIDDTSTTQKFTTAAEAAKLAGIETGATADQSDAEIATAYGNQVAAASQGEMEAGTEAGIRRMSPLRVAQAIAALGGSGGDPTYGSDAAADDDAVYVDENNWLGLGITNPLGPLHIYSGTAAPRTYYQYFNDDAGDVTAYPTTATSVTSSDDAWLLPERATADDGDETSVSGLGAPKNTEFLKAVGFGFDIDPGAAVVGVEVVVEALRGALGSSSDIDIHLVRGNVIDTAVDKSTGTALTTSYALYTFGGPTDDWGGITASEVNAEDFGCAIRYSVGAGGVTVDFVRINVYYTTAAGDWLWSAGIDNSDGAFTVRTDTDLFRIGTDGAVEFTDDVTAGAFIGDGSGLTGLPSAGIADPGTSTDRAILTWNGTTGDAVRDNTVGIDVNGNITLATGDTVDGRELSTDGAKLDGIEAGAEVNDVDSVNGQTGAVSLDADDIDTTGTTNKFVTSAEKTIIGNTSGTNTGDQSFSFSGDLSGTWSGGGSLAATVANGAITPAKMESFPEYSVLGRDSSGSGVSEYLDVAEILAMTGAGLADIPVPSPLTSGSTVGLNASDRNKLLTLPLAHDTTINFGTKTQGHKILIWIYQQGGDYLNTVDWDATDFVFSTDLPEPTLPTGSGNGALYSFLCVYDKYLLIAELEFNPF